MTESLIYREVEQGSDAWLEIRRGKVTASRVADVMAKTKTGVSASRGNYLFTVDFCADGDLDTTFTEQAEEHKSFNFIQLENGQFACQPNNRCLWYDQSLIPNEVKFPDFQAAQHTWSVDGTRKWTTSNDWFYTTEEKND